MTWPYISWEARQFFFPSNTTQTWMHHILRMPLLSTTNTDTWQNNLKLSLQSQLLRTKWRSTWRLPSQRRKEDKACAFMYIVSVCRCWGRWSVPDQTKGMGHMLSPVEIMRWKLILVWHCKRSHTTDEFCVSAVSNSVSSCNLCPLACLSALLSPSWTQTSDQIVQTLMLLLLLPTPTLLLTTLHSLLQWIHWRKKKKTPYFFFHFSVNWKISVTVIFPTFVVILESSRE